MAQTFRPAVGLLTGETSQYGKPIYKTKSGKRVSEIGRTFLAHDGKYYNHPSIIDGAEYSEDELRDMFKAGKIKPTGPYKDAATGKAVSQKHSDSIKAIKKKFRKK